MYYKMQNIKTESSVSINNQNKGQSTYINIYIYKYIVYKVYKYIKLIVFLKKQEMRN